MQHFTFHNVCIRKEQKYQTCLHKNFILMKFVVHSYFSTSVRQAASCSGKFNLRNNSKYFSTRKIKTKPGKAL